MAKPLPPLVDSLVDSLSSLGEVRVKRMFGGFGFYLNELFFAIVANDRFFLKVDEATKPKFEARGLAPFEFEYPDGRRISMSYYEAPEETLDSAIKMKPWAQLALQAAERAAGKKRK